MKTIYGVIILILLWSVLISQKSSTPSPPVEKTNKPKAVTNLEIKDDKSLLARAIAYAEGNIDLEGNPTVYMKGHRDPGNNKNNKGFCSANGFKGSVEEANRFCVSYLQRGLDKGLESIPKSFHSLPVLLQYLDLYNQSPAAAQNFSKYIEGKSYEDLLRARVYSFEGQAGGLFYVCRTNGYSVYKTSPLTERNKCIEKDQRRRLNQTLKFIDSNT